MFLKSLLRLENGFERVKKIASELIYDIKIHSIETCDNIIDKRLCKRIVASVGAQFVPVQLPVIQDQPVIALQPNPVVVVDPLPVVVDEPVKEVPVPGVTPEEPEGKSSA